MPPSLNTRGGSGFRLGATVLHTLCFGSLWLRRFRPGCCALLLSALLAAGGLGGCATVNGQAGAEADLVDEDPLEGLNRHIFAANLAVDTFLLRPAAVAYREIVPQPAKYVIRNFVNNLKLPWTFLNDLAQGQGHRAGVSFARFVVNSTIGIGGLFDPATDLGLPYHKEDFGQTLAVWGMDDGPYLVLPLLGPSNFRDAIGTGVSMVADPVKIAVNEADLEDEYLATQVADAVDARYRNLGTIDSLRERSLDFYATVRSLYRQRRADEIRNGSTDPTAGATVLSEQTVPGTPLGAASPRLPPSTVEVPATTRVEEASLPDPAPQPRKPAAARPKTAAPPPPPESDTNLAALPGPPEPAPRAAEPAPEKSFEHGAIEPGVGSAGSSHADSIRAFQQAARAYENALRSMPSNNPVSPE